MPIIFDLLRCQAARCGERTRVKHGVSWEASLSLHLSNLNSQSGEPYMNSLDRTTIVSAPNDIQAHLRAEEVKVDRNGMFDLVSCVLISTIGLILALTMGLAKCQHTLRSGFAAVRGQNPPPPSAPPVIYSNPRPLIASSSLNGPLH